MERVAAEGGRVTEEPAMSQVGMGAALQRLRNQVESVFRGKSDVVELVLTALFARGHVLLEDVPGVGKTTLARAVAHSLDLEFRRIQFTSDLLPADVVGVSVFSEASGDFEFRPGPVFANLVLADEINRTTPRTQSSLLEAMNERQVTVDNVTHPLDEPFIVLATQNPLEFSGTYPLPESQLDRFLLRVSIGYPAPADELEIIRSYGHVDPCEDLQPVMSRTEVLALSASVAKVRGSDEIMRYLMAIVEATRTTNQLALGVSTRGAMALWRAAQSHALVVGRDYVIPDDLKRLAAPVLAHRVTVRYQGDGNAASREQCEAVIDDLVDHIPVPA
jgi:MoxR-like ATPase